MLTEAEGGWKCICLHFLPPWAQCWGYETPMSLENGHILSKQCVFLRLASLRHWNAAICGVTKKRVDWTYQASPSQFFFFLYFALSLDLAGGAELSFTVLSASVFSCEKDNQWNILLVGNVCACSRLDCPCEFHSASVQTSTYEEQAVSDLK